MALNVGGQALPVPLAVAPGAAKALFDELCAKFGIHDTVSDFMVNSLGLETLADFQHMLTDTAKVEELIVSQIKNLPKPVLQAARIRQALEAVQQAAAGAALSKKRGLEDPDLESLLSAEQLNDLKEAFWRRYKVRYAADIEPSDAMLSRVAKELTKKMLTVHPVLKVRTMTQQLNQERKRRKLSDGIELLMHEEDAEEVAQADAATYMRCLWTLLLAMARAGVVALSTAPNVPELLSADSTAYVEMPLDLCIAYHARCTKRVAEVAPSRQFEWLRTRDEQERQIWVERHRSSGAPLGSIIKNVMMEREAMWLVSEQDKWGSVGGGGSQMGKNKASPVKPAVAAAKAKLTKGGKGAIQTVETTLDGQQLCAKWNQGQCKDPCAYNRLHACNAMTKANGRACGLRNHTSANCRHALR